MAKFEVGEIAIVLAADGKPTSECEIIAIPFSHSVSFVIDKYIIHVPGILSDGPDGYWYAHESDLRKKPPKEELGNYDIIEFIIGWNPTKQRETI